MATTLAQGSPALASSDSRARTDTFSWVLYPVLFSSAAIVIGLIWDISWHRSIGRDTFWSPPHVLEQLAAIVTGLTCGWLVLHTTFAGSPAERAASVRFWGFRGPLGAWVCIWGTLMMITSAPFDNWWHNAYGLDVKIISPPHIVLAGGMIGIQIGAMLLAVAAQNRAPDNERRRLSFVYVASAGILVTMAATVIMEDASIANEMHGSLFYKMTAAVFPIFLVATARASRLRWPATTAALVYTGIQLFMIWTLQLSPAHAMLAPIYNPITHMVPPPFPLLLVIPSFAIDLLMHRVGGKRDWLLAGVIGLAFAALMIAAHWFWSSFLISPLARNFFFGADHWDYSDRLGDWRYQYWNPVSGTGAIALVFIHAAVRAAISARLGLWWGKSMATVRR